MTGVRTFTQAEANDLLPTLEPLARQLRDAYDELLGAGRNLEDLGIVHGEAVQDPSHAAHAEWSAYAAAFQRLTGVMRDLVDRIHATGAVMKDPAIGLLDFHARRGAETVFLCWRLGEARVEHWHALREGFLGRKPIVAVEFP